VVSSRRFRRGAGLAGLLALAVGAVVAKGGTIAPSKSVIAAGGTVKVPTSPTTATPVVGRLKVPSSSTTATPVAGTAPATVEFTGDAESFPYGTIQVRLTVRGGRVVDVATVQAPQGGQSGQIAGFALPELRLEVLAAQSARIDAVSGASYDSQAYANSVQSALARLRG
jgi:uncharacterized protein with FMN-binding domain